jgi:hypothetical protein
MRIIIIEVQLSKNILPLLLLLTSSMQGKFRLCVMEGREGRGAPSNWY